MLSKVSLSTMFVVSVFVAIAPAGEMAVTSLSIDTGSGAISINGAPLVADTDFTFTLVNPNAGITGGLTTYSQIGLFELSSSYLTGYSGISIDASPSLGGARPLALAVPGDIIINASWQQIGGQGSQGTYPGGGGAAPCGGYAGGAGHPYYGDAGGGPGGGGGGGLVAAGGSLVAQGAPGGSSVNYATFPADFHQYGGSITIDSSGPVRDLCGGSGGGGANDGNKNAQSGSGGGGAVGFFSTVDSGSITVTSSGSIRMIGADGTVQYHYGGAGSGGTIILASGKSGTVTNDGSLQAKGGAPSNSNGGGGGEIAIYYGGSSVLGSGTYSVAGGSGAGTGNYYTEQLIGATTGDLTIKKFFDCDNNGLKDYSDDNLLANWEYHITGPGGYDQTLTTDGAGQIALTGLDPGNYTITETVKQDHSITTGNQGVVIAIAGGDDKTELFGNVLPGDINQDGLVDSVDFTILKANYGLSPKTWTQGNLNPLEDALVDSVDFTILKAYYGKGVPPGPGAVPEPASAALLVVGLGGMVLRRRAR